MTHYLADRSDRGVPAAQTDIPSHLGGMLALLLAEDRDAPGTGPCMEFVLQHKVLLTAVTVAQDDVRAVSPDRAAPCRAAPPVG